METFTAAVDAGRKHLRPSEPNAIAWHVLS